MGVAALNRARMSANESSAVASLKTINMAQTRYNVGCGRGAYASSLLILGRPPNAVNSSGGYLDAPLSTAEVVEHNGYRITVQMGAGGTPGQQVDCHGNGTMTAYRATAVPLAINATGSRSFSTNQNGGVWQLPGETAPTEPFGPPAELYR